MKDMLLNNFYDKTRIEQEFGITTSTLNNLIRAKRFPNPDELDGDKPYWHILSLNRFIRVYNKLQTAKNKYSFDYSKQREQHIVRARRFIEKHDISSPFEYREVQKTLGINSAPNPATLFCHSITFEELLYTDLILDNTCTAIVHHLREKHTAKELSIIIGTTERTIYRKLKVLREAGHVIHSDASGVWM